MPASFAGGDGNNSQSVSLKSKRAILKKRAQKLISAHGKLSNENTLLKDKIAELEEELTSLKQQEVNGGVWSGNGGGGYHH